MYSITFQNHDIFEGGNLENSKWNKIPDIPIVTWEYMLFGQKVLLQGFEVYNHLIERVNYLGSERVAKVILLACVEDKVERVIFDLHVRRLFRDQRVFGKEYQNKPTTGWKLGLHNNPNIQIEAMR